jgi:hypothetical protein
VKIAKRKDSQNIKSFRREPKPPKTLSINASIPKYEKVKHCRGSISGKIVVRMIEEGDFGLGMLSENVSSEYQKEQISICRSS